MTEVAKVKVSFVGNRVFVHATNLHPLHIPKSNLERIHERFIARLQEDSSLSGCEFQETGEYRQQEDQYVQLCLVLPPPVERHVVQQLSARLQIVAEQFWQPYREKLETAQVA